MVHWYAILVLSVARSATAPHHNTACCENERREQKKKRKTSFLQSRLDGGMDEVLFLS